MADNDYSELKRLLLEDEQSVIDEIHRRITDKNERAGDIAESLPDAIRLRTAQDDLLTETLEEPVSECVNRMIRDKPALFVDAVSPVIGPAIRRSIYEALRSLTDTINRTLEQSLSSKGLKWRLEAARTGVPFAEVVLKHTLLYRVEQIFLIHKDSGLLIDHITAEDVETGDSDAVSGMLTAIQDFVRESFARGGSEELDTVDMGDHTLWLLRSRSALMACVIRGIPPRELRQQLQSVLDNLQDYYSKPLEKFSGDSDDFPGIADRLSPALAEQTKQESPEEEARRNRNRQMMAAIIGLPLAAFLTWWIVTSVIHSYRMGKLQDHLMDRTGIVVTEVSSDWRKVRIEGLADPLVGLPWDAVDAANIKRESVTLAFGSYQSLAPEIVLKRARKQLKIPGGVSLTLRDGILKLTGPAPNQWVDRLNDTWIYPPGVDGIDTSNLNHQKPAPKPAKPPRLSAEIKQLISALSRVQIRFNHGVEMSSESQPALFTASRILARLERILPGSSAHQVEIVIVGDSDGTGDASRNRRIRLERANYVRNALLETNPAIKQNLKVAMSDALANDYDPERRRAYFQISGI